MISQIKFQELAGQVDPLAFLDLTEYLAAIFAQVKQEVKTYTYFDLSEHLGLSRSNVAHLILRGKRPLTVKAGEKISAALGLTATRRVYFENLVLCHASRKPELRQKAMKKLFQLKQEQASSVQLRLNLEFLSEWFYPVLREMALSGKFPLEAKTLAKLFVPSLRPEQVRAGLSTLEGLGYLTWDESTQKYRTRMTRLSTGDEVDGVAVVRYHQKMMDLAKDALFRFQEEERDISSISFRAPLKIFEQIKDEVRAFRKKMLFLAESSAAKTDERVYQMNMQLFPTSLSVEELEEEVA